MRALIIKLFILGTFITISVSQQAQVKDLQKAEKYEKDFMQFLERFSKDDEFQLSRIKFPIIYICLDETLTKLDTSYIEKQNWKIRHFGFEPESQYYSQVYDNFEHKLRNTDERVFAWHGIGNGIKIFLYFKRIEGYWYLIKEEDLST